MSRAERDGTADPVADPGAAESGSGRPAAFGPWWPDARRLADALRTAAVTVLAAAVAACGLIVWAGSGKAGTPARIEVGQGRVLQPVVPGRTTSAYFRIVNSGGSPDRLRKVTWSERNTPAELTQHRMTAEGGGYRERADSFTVPAGAEFGMSRFGPAVAVTGSGDWRPGDRIAFTLDFERSGPVTVEAVVTPLAAGEEEAAGE
ncbi:copper chaperone PCu(A)C [Streptomyces sp. NPDC047968]|uniref:copper chaperone PCu(A)C n=1 Tax=unclassified Streptomyces TaxID=2593676 RepID=UPI0034446E49